MSTLQALSFRAKTLLTEEAAVSATEYAVLLALLVLVAVATIHSIGSRVFNVYESINTVMPE